MKQKLKELNRGREFSMSLMILENIEKYKFIKFYNYDNIVYSLWLCNPENIMVSQYICLKYRDEYLTNVTNVLFLIECKWIVLLAHKNLHFEK